MISFSKFKKEKLINPKIRLCEKDFDLYYNTRALASDQPEMRFSGAIALVICIQSESQHIALDFLLLSLLQPILIYGIIVLAILAIIFFVL